MSDERGRGSGVHASSTGQMMTEAGWLDAHFEACRPEYEAMLRSVGLQPDWRVLDAGCGGGSFLPLMSELVGPAGRIAALDLAPDNIGLLERRVAEWGMTTPVDGRVGSVLALPYADDTFDAVWCANTSQYLTDGELATMLEEFRRVVRPGGLVAIKEFDGTLPLFLPAPPLTHVHLFEEVARGGNVQVAGTMRAPSLAAWLRHAGLREVRMRTTLVERSAPPSRALRQYKGDGLKFWAMAAREYELPAAERAVWERLTDPAGRDLLFEDPDFSYREGHIVAVGMVP